GDGKRPAVRRVDPLAGDIGLARQQRRVLEVEHAAAGCFVVYGHQCTPRRRRTAGAPSDTPDRKRRTKTMRRITCGAIGGGQRRAAKVAAITAGMAKSPVSVEGPGRLPAAATRPMRNTALSAKTPTSVSRIVAR